MHILADYINCAQHVEYRTFTDYFCETSHVLSPNLPLNTNIGFFGVVFVYKTHLYQSKKMHHNYTTEQVPYALMWYTECFNVVQCGAVLLQCGTASTLCFNVVQSNHTVVSL